MAYHIIDPEDVEPMKDRSAQALPITEAAGFERRNAKLGIRLYHAAPGEQLPLAYHLHREQVEAFYVISGPLVVETPEEAYTVETDQTFIAEPGSPHLAYNPESARSAIKVLAIGAPSVDDAERFDPAE